jgi:hypothetical protein
LLPRPAIDGMQRIDRPAVQTDIRGVAVQLEMALPILVTPLAERLELAEKEFVHVAMMRLNVIGDDRGRHGPTLQTGLAEWVL